MHLRTRHISFLLPVLFALAGFFSCAREEVLDSSEGDTFPVALSLGSGQAATKTIDAISQIGETFRGIEDPVLIPFSRRGKVVVSDKPLGVCTPLGTISSLNAVSQSRLYNKIYVPRTTSSFLFYGAAIDNGSVPGIADGTIARKKRNGSIIATGLEDREPSGIFFAPDPFVSDASALSTAQQAIVDVLSSLLTVSFEYYHKSSTGSSTWLPSSGAHTETITWNDSFGDTNLQNWFVQLTNGGDPISGAGVALEKILTDIYNKLSTWTYGSTSSYPYIGGYQYCYYGKNNNYRITERKYYEMFRDALLAKIDAVATKTGTSGNYTLSLRDADMLAFPGNYGLPDGATAVKYEGTDFVISDSSSGDVRMPLGQFCYPAQIWYFCNSRIKTTYVESHDYTWLNTNYYTNSSTWDTILAQYENDNATVTRNVTGIAIKDRIQYGTALLESRLGAVTTTLYDGGTGGDRVSFTIAADDTRFPLEGIIVGGQRRQGFDFTPVDVDDYFIYDTDFGDSYYIRSTQSGSFRTSVFQSTDGEPLRIALEFRNNSGVTFKGASGFILPGYKFYLLGMLNPAAASQPDGETLSSVFVGDHITTVTFSIPSLDKAYNTIPDLRDPQLQLGVTAQIDWVLSTPEERILY